MLASPEKELTWRVQFCNQCLMLSRKMWMTEKETGLVLRKAGRVWIQMLGLSLRASPVGRWPVLMGKGSVGLIHPHLRLRTRTLGTPTVCK